MVAFVARVFYKDMGVSNTLITAYVSLLAWPWVIKPLWSPLVDNLGAKRTWILATQVLIALSLAGIALAVPLNAFLSVTLIGFGLLAFASATHDISADGFYMLAMDSHKQAWWVGIRSTCYRVGLFACQGLLLMLAGYLTKTYLDHYSTETGSRDFAWQVVFFVTAAVMLGLAIYHALIIPKPQADVSRRVTSFGQLTNDIVQTFVTFFQKPGIWQAICFLLLYRFSEAQLGALKHPFLLDELAVGGLGLDKGQVGFIDGTVGLMMLLTGGILGAWLAAKDGLKAWLWLMVITINIPNAAFFYLAYFQPQDTLSISVAVAIEQFGYGFGFAGYMLYMLYIARGNHETAHYAICTGFMALGYNFPGFFSGWLQENLGYTWFFGWVLVATIPSFLVAWLVPIDSSFGRKQEA